MPKSISAFVLVERCWNTLPCEIVDVHFLEGLNARMDGLRATWSGRGVPAYSRGLERGDLPTYTHSMILQIITEFFGLKKSLNKIKASKHFG